MFLDLISQRRSIRRYDPKPVEGEILDKLVETALRAPSSRGLNPWTFIFVTNPDTIGKLSEAKPHGASFLRKAPLAVVVCANPGISDVWVEDAAIASIFLHLAAADLGLGSCWIQIRKRMHNEKLSAHEYVAQLLGLPATLDVDAIIAMGYPAETKNPHRKNSLQYEKIHYNQYGRKNQ
ncbi:MAG: NAD(P)H-dependent dehydrogenase/reductase [Desulfobacteraceae bacterium]|nr:NAD(P)H-dependent dehydrogenase/reductase [Desulfobacteraceae bacterium]